MIPLHTVAEHRSARGEIHLSESAVIRAYHDHLVIAPLSLANLCETSGVKIFGEDGHRTVLPFLVYLDLNKWVEIAKWRTEGSQSGRPEGFDTALRWATSGTVLFPLSSGHFFEIAKIGDDKRRRTLANTMADLSQGWFLVSPGNLIKRELRRAMARTFHKTFSDIPPVPITRNISWVFARPDQVDLAREDRLFQQPGFLREYLATARINRPFLESWDRIAQEHEWSRGIVRTGSRTLRKRAYCARLTMAIREVFESALVETGLTSTDMGKLGPDGAVQLLESVSFLDVEMFLHVERNEHRDRRIQANDEIDIGFLRMAVPYCDHVITEKFWSSLLLRNGFDEKYVTTIGSDLTGVLARVASKVGMSMSVFDEVGKVGTSRAKL